MTHRILPAVLAVVLLSAPHAAAAGQLQAGPTLLEIGPESSATRLVLGNTGTTPIAAQVRVYAWTQVDGEDQLVPSDALVVSPPIVELPAAAEQTVRVVRLGALASGHDQTYRIVVDELPQGDAGRENTVNIRLRYIIPVFVRAANSTAPTLSCALESDSRLSCANGGGRAAQLGASRLLGAGDQAVNLSDGLFGYVLPGSRRVWLLQTPVGAPSLSNLRMETRLNGQPTTLPVARTP
jgi:fimbrial chaperone protein